MHSLNLITCMAVVYMDLNTWEVSIKIAAQ